MQRGAPQRIPVDVTQGVSLGAPAPGLLYAWLQGNRQPVNVTGYTATLIASASALEPAVYSSSTTPTAQGSIAVNGLAGTVACSSTPAQTATIPAGEYEYVLTLTSPSGQVTTLAYGPFRVRAARKVTP